jgi:hypothetical protein
MTKSKSWRSLSREAKAADAEGHHVRAQLLRFESARVRKATKTAKPKAKRAKAVKPAKKLSRSAAMKKAWATRKANATYPLKINDNFMENAETVALHKLKQKEEAGTLGKAHNTTAADIATSTRSFRTEMEQGQALDRAHNNGRVAMQKQIDTQLLCGYLALCDVARELGNDNLPRFLNPAVDKAIERFLRSEGYSAEGHFPF